MIFDLPITDEDYSGSLLRLRTAVINWLTENVGEKGPDELIMEHTYPKVREIALMRYAALTGYANHIDILETFTGEGWKVIFAMKYAGVRRITVVVDDDTYGIQAKLIFGYGTDTQTL
jgi:hypothetical protein